ncbi:CrcB family protein [Peribacillus frigoritolerans]|nr:CrcB family protein [Peribacillus frigoritolerans]
MDRFKSIFAVGFGGAAGAILRYRVILTAGHSFFPLGTLLINIVGSFLLGMINGYFASKKKSFVFFGAGQRVLRRFHHDVHIFLRKW